jgi:hypothetical protein
MDKKTKTVTFEGELWVRMQNCMAATHIFNSSEFIRLALEAAIERVERKFSLSASGAAPNDEVPSGGNGRAVVDS